MRLRRGIAGCLCAALLLSACASTGPKSPWAPRAPGAVALEREGVDVTLPPGWIQFAAYGQGLLITRDGLPVQFIKIVRASHKAAFANIGKEGSPDLLPNELAELLIASHKARPGMGSTVVKENRPAEVAGRDGARLRFGFRNERGAAYDDLAYAVATETGVLMFQYQALSRHFFARDLPAFEALVASARMNGKTAKTP